MDEIIKQKFADKSASTLYYVANTPEDAVNYLKNYNPKIRTFDKAKLYKR
jgi:hypothetical protein